MASDVRGATGAAVSALVKDMDIVLPEGIASDADVETAADGDGQGGDDPVTAHPTVDPVDPIILDRFTLLVAQVLDVPVVCVSLMDDLGRTVKSTYGLGTPGGAPLTPFLGMRLNASDGRPVGNLTLMDRKPWRLNAPQLGFLRELAVRLVAQVDIGPVERMM